MEMMQKLAGLFQIIADLRVRYVGLNLHYEAAWTDGGRHHRCLHQHRSPADAARCAMSRSAGWHVLAVEVGTARELTEAEARMVNEFRFKQGRFGGLCER
jgi:hypothetical protein